MKLSGARSARLYLLLLLMISLWAGNFIVSKIALREIPSLTLVMLRTTLAGLMMLPVYWWDGRGGEHRWHWSDAPKLLALGVIGVALNQVFFIVGIARTSVGHAALLVCLVPLWVLLLASARGLEKLTVRKLVGLGIAISGVALLQTMPSRHGSGTVGPSFIGDLFIMMSGWAFTLYTVLGKELSRKFGTVTMTTFGYTGGAVVLAPLTLWLSLQSDLSRVSWVGWTSLAYMTICSSIIAYLIYYYALSHLSASRVSAFNYLQPPIAMLLAVPFLGEPLTGALVSGGTLVMFGVFLTERG